MSNDALHELVASLSETGREAIHMYGARVLRYAAHSEMALAATVRLHAGAPTRKALRVRGLVTTGALPGLTRLGWSAFHHLAEIDDAPTSAYVMSKNVDACLGASGFIG